jgi:cellulose synthase (UDP-forming)
MRRNSVTRISAIIALLAYGIYISYILTGINFEYPLLSVLYIVFNLLALMLFALSIFNTWTAEIPRPILPPINSLPKVAVIIPTWSEPVDMIRNTVMSILQQDYPQNKIVLVISDDANNSQLAEFSRQLQQQFPTTEIIYHIPPSKGDTARNGEAKSGNLNSAFELMKNRADLDFIETRDADDLVGHPLFLKLSLGHLMSDNDLAFVQSTKSSYHAPGDPFNNREDFFYRAIMLYKNGANAVFPCGSGLVWRKAALIDIGGFPSWNLVEDFQSGSEALRRGWKGMYIPILGALGQTAPEDIPNMFKQRGTWALDSIRFFLWGEKRGLSLEQKLHYYESGLMYLFSAATYLYTFVLAAWLWLGARPIDADVIIINLFHFSWLFTFYVFLKSIADTGDLTTTFVVKATRNLFSLGPLHLEAAFKSWFYGPNKKPTYKVTRKSHKHGLYLHYVLPQIFTIALLAAAAGYNIYLGVTAGRFLDVSNIFWAAVFIVIYSKPVKNAFHGLKFSLF